MFAEVRYLTWARQYFGSARYNLGSSGEPTVSLDLSKVDLHDPSGPLRFREAIASHNSVAAEECQGALGASHALFLAMSAVLEPGDEAIIEWPTYEPLVRIAEGLGARVRKLPREAALGYRVDPEQIANMLAPKTRLVALTNLHNPSGIRVPDDALREVAALLEPRGAFLLVDETFAAFDELCDAHGRFLGSARRLGANVIGVSGLTKTYGLGPMRIGWVLAEPELAARVSDQLVANMGILGFDHANLAAHAFSQVPQLRSLALARRGSKRETVRETVLGWRTHGPVEWSDPEAGLFGFLRLPGRNDLRARIEAGLTTHEVITVPGHFFGDDEGLRLAWTLDEQDLGTGLRQLERVLFHGR